jgi:NADPH:quinone reductase-like Zn-dependent oxidoreductase
LAPYVLGFDFSGLVAKLGSEDPRGLHVGDPVLGGIGKGGCYAEYAVVQDHRDKWIYIAGAGSGRGHFAVQMAKINWLKVVGSAGKSTTIGLLHRLGVDRVIDYSRQDVVYNPTNSPSSYQQSSAAIASGGEYIRLGTSAQLKQFESPDLPSVVEAREGKKIIGDLGRYSTDPEFQNPQARARVIHGLEQAVQWTEEGKLKAEITKIVPFNHMALQQAFEAFPRGEINVGKVVIRRSVRIRSELFVHVTRFLLSYAATYRRIFAHFRKELLLRATLVPATASAGLF